MKLIDFIVELSYNAIDKPSKYLDSGHNGPYLDPETP